MAQAERPTLALSPGARFFRSTLDHAEQTKQRVLPYVERIVNGLHPQSEEVLIADASKLDTNAFQETLDRWFNNPSQGALPLPNISPKESLALKRRSLHTSQLNKSK